MTDSPQVYELREYATKTLAEYALPEAQAILLDARYGSQIQVIPPTFRNSTQWQLTSLGWVGYIPLTPKLHFRLTPKVALQNLFGMWEYAYRLRSFRFFADLIDCQSLEDFFEQMANVLAKRVLDRGRKGFYRAYLSEYERLPYVRGRIDISQKTRAPWDVHLACHYEEHTADIEDNQLLTYTLWRIAQSGVCSDRVLPMIRNAYRSLQNLTSFQSFSPAHCIGRSYNRLNEDYQLLHALSRFFLEQSGPTHEIGDRRIMPFLVDMAQLFELFVAEWLEAHLPPWWQMMAQKPYHFGQESEQHFKIDLVLSDAYERRPCMVLDTKYKTPDQPDNRDIFQIVAYAEAMGCTEAVLIYPQHLKQPLDVHIGAIRVRSLTFALDGDLEAAGHTLLSALGIL